MEFYHPYYPDKINVVKEFPDPKNVKELKSFLGLAQYYKRFIFNNSLIAAQKAFETLKNALTKPPILAYVDFNETYQLQVDTSSENTGYVLAQEQNGKEVAIAYSGRKFNPAERKPQYN